ncbi:MAG: DUF350 domain-containing protein, partial [Cytophagaceae bacterium]
MIQSYLLRPLLFLGVTLILLTGLKVWFDRVTPYNDDSEITDGGNIAIVLQRVGVYLALVISIAGSLNRTRYDLWEDLSIFVVDGLVALVLLIVCSYANDRLILHQDANFVELQRGNKAVGVLEAGAFIATGSILAGAFGGDGGGIASAIVFAILGQVALVLLYWLHDWRTPANLDQEIKRGNVAAACMLSGELIALGIILRASISGPFVSWVGDASSFGASLVGALFFLWLTRIVVDWLFLPLTTIRQQMEKDNVAVGALVGGLNVGAALAVAAI